MTIVDRVEGKHGICWFIDCVEYMESLADNTFDLGFADPPWGHNYDGHRPMGINAQVVKENVENYKDDHDPTWAQNFSNELKRVCERSVICMGWKHFNWWVANTNPVGYHFLVFKNGQGQTQVCNHNAVHPFLCYGDWKGESAEEGRARRFHWNFTESCLEELHDFMFTYHYSYIPNGFLRDGGFIPKKLKKLVEGNQTLMKGGSLTAMLGHQYKHPSPKPFDDIRNMLIELNPTSLFDPTAGTNPIGEYGETYEVQWTACELNPAYRNDIEFRIARGQQRREEERKKPKQRTLI